MSSTPLSEEPEPSVWGIWSLNAALGVTAAALWLLVLRNRGVPSGFHLPWPLLALGFAGAEKWAVHLRFRGRSQTLGLAELPLVLGLAFCTPSQLIVAQVLGGAGGLILDRRVEPVKLGFNLALFALTAATAASVFTALAHVTGPPDIRVWAALIAATLMADLVAYTAMIALYALLGGLPSRRDAVSMLLVGACETLGMTIVGLLPVTLLGYDLKSAWLLVAPAAAAIAAFRSLARDRLRAERLEQMYRTLGTAELSDVLEQRVRGLLESALAAFDATHAELLLEDDGQYRRFCVPGEAEEVEELSPGDRYLLDEAGTRAILVRTRRSGDRDPLAERGLARGMATVMHGHAGTGVLLVGDRGGHDASFLQEDLVRFEAFAAQANAGLQIVRLRRLERAAHEEARRDDLTQLANRKRYGEIVAEALRNDQCLSVASIDIDDFKVINGRLGHDAGDTALQEIARRVQRALPTGDVVARLGGDEFACVFSNARTVEQAEERASAVLREVARPLTIEGHRFTLTASAGVVCADSTSTANALLTYADLALTEAKLGGGGRVARFEPHLLVEAQERRKLETDLERGLEEGEIEAFYQPLIELRSGELYGFEALARWRHPERGLLAPAAFMHVAEATGLILPLGRAMLHQACRQAARFDALGGRPLVVSVNLSAAQLCDDSLASQVTSELRAAGTDPSRLWLEVTETIAMDDAEQNLERLKELRETGAALALDDFGTGHSSLAYLQRFPFTVIKLARELVDRVDAGQDERRIVDTVAELAAAFGMRCVAEGIERQRQVPLLNRFDIGQGFLWSRPMPAADAESLVAHRARPNELPDAA